MKFLVTPILISLCALLTSASTFAQTSVVVKVGVVKGRVASVNPSTNAMTLLVEPGDRPVNFSGVERARIERPQGRLVTMADLRPGTAVAVYYTSYNGHPYPTRILIPDPNLVVPVTGLTPAEDKALDSKAANDGDITTNPGVKARIDRDITTQPGRKDPADPDITKQPK